MIVFATETDLSLPEFVAFHHGKRSDLASSWPAPFALFQARLSGTMAVLDCSIDPGALPARWNELYSHGVYRRVCPVSENGFIPPFGVPDGAFDRVICNATLENLASPDRDSLVAAMAQMLKPDGWLVVTSILESGETPDALIRLCERHRLVPGAGAGARRIDGSVIPKGDLIRYSARPACVGGIFSKSAVPAILPAKGIVFSLLTWNTRGPSVESVGAILDEARMLRRLGYTTSLCICDNGSHDGTADAMRALESQFDLPYRLILNPRNLGNSIARNQIIEYMLETDADYLLMMDGDIEIVPFSSVAMLRHMENCGHRLGCIGAHSAGQTPHRERASPFLPSIHGTMIDSTSYVAWTQYGMFRRSVFEDGVRFETRHPFDGPGWGFEDNDLAFQMTVKGYVIQYFFRMVYLHRHLHSSFRSLHESGLDPALLYDLRKQFVIDKWTSIPEIDDGRLALIEQDQYPERPIA